MSPTKSKLLDEVGNIGQGGASCQEGWGRPPPDWQGTCNPRSGSENQAHSTHVHAQMRGERMAASRRSGSSPIALFSPSGSLAVHVAMVADNRAAELEAVSSEEECCQPTGHRRETEHS